MNGFSRRSAAVSRQRRDSRASRAMVGCEALEGRQLLSRGLGLVALGGMGGGVRTVSLKAELGSFAGGGPGAMFGAGNYGLGGGARNPIFLLTSSLLNTGTSTTPPSKGVLSSSAVQSAFQTLQTDLNNDVTVGSRPTHATVGQLQDDLLAIHKGTLTGTAATTAIQNDEAAILTAMGLTSTQVGQVQADLQAVQAAIQSGGSGGSGSSGSTTTADTSGSSSATATDPGTTSDAMTAPLASSTTGATPVTSAASSAIQSAFQTLQTDLKSDLTVNAQPTNASIGQVEDDLNAIGKGTLSGSQALATIKDDTAAVFTGAGMSQAQIAQIQSDQAALATAIQNDQGSSSGSTSSADASSASPTRIAAGEATMQSVQPYLVGVPGLDGMGMGGSGGPQMGGFGGRGMGGIGGPMMGGFGGGGQVVVFDPGMNGPGGPAVFKTGGPVAGTVIRSGGPGGPAVFESGGPGGQAVLTPGGPIAGTVIRSGGPGGPGGQAVLTASGAVGSAANAPMITSSGAQGSSGGAGAGTSTS